MQSLITKIETLEPKHHIIIGAILKKDINIKFNENKNGVMINASTISEESIQEIKKFLSYIEEQETKSEEMDIEFEYKAEDDEKGMFSGYGSIFGNKDLGNDVVVEGAFAKSIGKKGAKAVKMLYQHRQEMMN